MNYTTVALATDRAEFCNEVELHLKTNDIQVLHISQYDKPLKRALKTDPDLVVLDCWKQGVQGLSLCRTIRSSYNGPLVLISQPDQEPFTLLALQLGADIALSAAGSSRLIAENIQALLGRLTASSASILQFGELTIDAGKREAFVRERKTGLSTMEFRLLWLLCKKAGRAVSREVIHQELYATPYNGYDRSIDLYVSRVRQKIGDRPSAPEYLKTVRGIGYQFVAPPADHLP